MFSSKLYRKKPLSTLATFFLKLQVPRVRVTVRVKVRDNPLPLTLNLNLAIPLTLGLTLFLCFYEEALLLHK